MRGGGGGSVAARWRSGGEREEPEQSDREDTLEVNSENTSFQFCFFFQRGNYL